MIKPRRPGLHLASRLPENVCNLQIYTMFMDQHIRFGTIGDFSPILIYIYTPYIEVYAT